MKRLSHTSGQLLAVAALVLLLAAPAARATDAKSLGWLGPVAVVPAADGKRLFVALADAQQVAVVAVDSGAVATKVNLPEKPTALALDPRSGRVYVACEGSAGMVCAIDANTLQVVQSIPVGHTPTGLAVPPDGTRLFVCNRFNNDVSVVALPEGKTIARVKTSREPVGAAVTPDGKAVWVIDLLPAGRANDDSSSAVVTVIDAASLATTAAALPRGSSGVRGICVSPDGRYAFVTHILSRNALPTTQLERGWMNTNAVSVFDVPGKKRIDTVLLDNADGGAANPWGVACSPDGATLYVAQSGTHNMSIINVNKLLQKISARQASIKNPPKLKAATAPSTAAYGIAREWDTSVLSPPLTPKDDLAFLAGVGCRIPLPGEGPRGLAVAGDKVYVAMYYADTLDAVDCKGGCAEAAVKSMPLGPPPQMTQARRGDLLFHDARRCFQHWQSCATCHPDARVDALNWDLMNDDFGNPKNTKSMLFAHRTPPAMSESVRESAEMAVRAGFQNILFMRCSDHDAAAVDAYLKSLRPVPSPHLVDGMLSPAALRGKELFDSKRIGCVECHPAPLFTDQRRHNVGTRGPYDHGETFDTPSLVEAWRTAPYLHDGSVRTIDDLLGKAKHGSTVGAVDSLSPQELADLVEYVLSL